MAQLTTMAQAFSGDTSEVDDTAQHELGTEARDTNGNRYIYAKGVASTALNSWVSMDEDYVTTLLAANAKGRVGIAMAAIVADKYGWYQVYGEATGKVLASFADNGIPFATSTPGSVDDAVVAGDLVLNAIGRSAISGGVATFELNYPSVNDTLG